VETSSPVLHNRLEPGNNDIGLYVTSFIALDILCYQLIPHSSAQHYIISVIKASFMTTQNPFHDIKTESDCIYRYFIILNKLHLTWFTPRCQVLGGWNVSMEHLWNDTLGNQTIRYMCIHTPYRCNYKWLISFLCITWRWPTFVPETCSCALHIVNSIPPNLYFIPYSLIYSTHNGDDAPQN